jgi:hypothetical protein
MIVFEGFSDYPDEMLRGMGQKHILNVRDIFRSHPETNPFLQRSAIVLHV